MQLIKNMSVGAKIFSLVFILLLLLAGVAIYGVTRITEVGDEFKDVTEQEMPISALVNLLATNQMDVQVAFERSVRYSLTNQRDEVVKNNNILAAKSKESDEHFKKLNEIVEKCAKNAEKSHDAAAIQEIKETKEHLKAMESEYREFEKEIITALNLLMEGKLNVVAGMEAKIDKDVDHIDKTISDMIKLDEKFTNDAVKKIEADEALAIKLMISVAIIALIIGLLVAFMVTRGITIPLRAAVDACNRLADGDLTFSIIGNGKDETGVLLDSMRKMQENLRNMIAGILDSSNQVASAAAQISANSGQLTKAAHGQASASDETSATMVQMAASIQTVAGNADSLASNADEVSSSIQELGASSEQVAKSAEAMASSVSETSATIEQMTVSIEKVAKSSEDLASSVTETSSTVEQMTVSIDQVAGNAQELQKVVVDSASIIEEMAASIKQVAKNVEDADGVAKGAAKEGKAGIQAGQQAAEGMSKVAEVIDKTSASIVNLGKRSEEIGNIVKVINEIADQTNLLALNAAIEAARAGDAGRGFAVVAEEVRKLAERSMIATKEIAQVIRQVQVDTGESVKYGEIAAQEAKASMELTNVAGNAIENIVASIEQTSSLMSDIARMTAEQASASSQVIRAVEKMNQATDVVAGAAREQALGGRQIRLAVERMNHITQEVSVATKEQAAGSKQIRIAVENMNHVTGQVSIATKEQSLSARQIVTAVNGMNSLTQSVANATAEQKKGGEMVVQAMENISDLTRENLSSVEQLSRAAQSLSQQAVEMNSMVSVFKI